jgi:hypothetical protein
MFIRKLRPNETAATTADRICIGRLPDGRMTWSGSVTIKGVPVCRSGSGFPTIQEAETDAINWARGRGAANLYIEVSNA